MRAERVDEPATTGGGNQQDAPAPWSQRETLTLAGVLVAMLLAFQWRLSSVIISDMDEGTYLYAGQLMAQGLVPYRDFLLAHPPMIAWFSAAWSWLFGTSIMPIRFVYLAVVLASTVPLYALVRSITRSQIAALLAMTSCAAGMLLLANMGRTVRLEPLMNAFVIAAVAIRYLRPSSHRWMAVMGAALACAVLVKAIAVIPAVLLVASDLVWHRPMKPLVVRWLLALAGACVVLIPALGWCFSQPRFIQDVLLSQVNRPRLGFPERFHYLAQNFMRFPPVFIGLVASIVLVARAGDARLRGLGLLALGNTLILFFAFKTFFGYYIVQALPWLACTFAVTLDKGGARWLGERWNALSYATVGLIGVVAPLAYTEIYFRTAKGHVAEPLQILHLLERDDGYVYSMYPAFGLWSQRRLYPWYYQADSLVPRINNWVGDRDFLEVFQGSSALVLYPGELDKYPMARAYVGNHFQEELHATEWAVWLRTSAGTKSDAPPVR